MLVICRCDGQLRVLLSCRNVPTPGNKAIPALLALLPEHLVPQSGAQDDNNY